MDEDRISYPNNAILQPPNAKRLRQLIIGISNSFLRIIAKYFWNFSG